MKRLYILFAVMLGLVLSHQASAQHAGHGARKTLEAPAWTKSPVLFSASGFSRKGASYQAYYMHAMEATAYASYDGETPEHLQAATQNVSLDDNGKLSLGIGADGGYYLVRVVGHGPEGEEAIATTLKYFSKPGPAPRDLLNAGRPGFEIAPAILPREHSRFRENETWPFRVRMDGAPVPGALVLLETSNGSKIEFKTDEQGFVDIVLPGDFADIPKDQWRHGRPPSSQFVLSVRDGALLATFNGDYSLDAFGNKNLWAGVGFAVLGMIAAVPLVRRRKQA